MSVGKLMTTRETAGFLSLIKAGSGILLGRNEIPLLEAAVARRVEDRNLPRCGSLLAEMKDDLEGAGLSELISEVAPGATRFFRDRESFQFIARFLRERATTRMSAPRLWSAGCSTGEEVYSLAMTLQPLLEEIGPETEILGTDINPAALEQACEGCYSAADLSRVSAACRERFFPEAGRDGQRKAVRELREMVRFKKHNLAAMSCPMDGLFAVILCRNTMMYFDEALKSRLVGEFQRSLEPGGCLVTGHMEQLSGIENLFEEIGPAVYRRRSDIGDSSLQRQILVQRNEAAA